MMLNATAEIAQTPAARPSTPSLRLTTFMTATSPSTVSGPPRSPKSTAPRNGRVMLRTTTPALTRISEATIWPISLTPGGRSRTSSIAPTITITAAPVEDPARSLASRA